MNDRVTVGADRNEVADWIDAVLGSNVRELSQMMHMYEATGDRAVHAVEVEVANSACGAVMSETKRARLRITLVPIRRDALNGPLNYLRTSWVG